MRRKLFAMGLATALALCAARTAQAWLFDATVSTDVNSRNDYRRIDESRNENSHNRYSRQTTLDSFNRYDNRSYDDHAISSSFNTDSRTFDSHAIADSYKQNTFDESMGKRVGSHDIGGDARNSVFGDLAQTIGGDNTQTFGDVSITGPER